MKPCFDIEYSEEMSRVGDYLYSQYHDKLPLPKTLGVKNYIYVAFIWIPPRQRRKGLAKQYFRKLLRTKRAVFIRLTDGLEVNGTVLEPFLKRQGFVIFKKDEYEMAKACIIDMVRR